MLSLQHLPDIFFHPAGDRGLSYEPSEKDLMNEVASKIPTHWRQVGCELGLTAEQLNCIDQQRRGIQMNCFSDVFEWWKNQQTQPYTWATIIRALRAPQVNQPRLADTLQGQFIRR